MICSNDFKLLHNASHAFEVLCMDYFMRYYCIIILVINIHCLSTEFSAWINWMRYKHVGSVTSIRSINELLISSMYHTNQSISHINFPCKYGYPPPFNSPNPPPPQFLFLFCSSLKSYLHYWLNMITLWFWNIFSILYMYVNSKF